LSAPVAPARDAWHRSPERHDEALAEALMKERRIRFTTPPMDASRRCWTPGRRSSRTTTFWSRFSFVDRVSFLIMRRRGVRVAFAFDAGFERAGFRLFAGHAGD
jgi:predicted nucleic acid-binding protein